MAYVDLNPVRAGIARTPEASDYTSIRERLVTASTRPEIGGEKVAVDAKSHVDAPEDEVLQTESELQFVPEAPLMPFDATGQAPWAIPFAFEDYVELIDWTGRALRLDKRGYITGDQPKILNRLDIDGEHFISYADRLLKEFGTAVGAPQALVNLCARRQAKYLRGMRAARQMFAAKGAGGTAI